MQPQNSTRWKLKATQIESLEEFHEVSNFHAVEIEGYTD